MACPGVVALSLPADGDRVKQSIMPPPSSSNPYALGRSKATVIDSPSITMDTHIDIGAFAHELISIPSPSGAEVEVLQRLESWAAERDLGCRRVAVDERRYNLLIGGGARIHTLLSTHVDTVPGGSAPVLEGDVLRGRGSCDAKGIAAAMLGALCDLRAAGQAGVAVLLVVGEETSSDGAKAAARALDPVRYIVNGEPTELQLVRAQRGLYAARLSARGQACHSAYPELGHSALHALLDALGRMRAHPWPRDPELGETLVNVGTIGGGSASNVLAEEAWAEIVMRLVGGVDAVAAQVASLIGPEVQVDVHTMSDPQRLFVPAGRPSVVVGFGSDVAHLRPLGMPLMVGPGSIHDAHTEHEQVRLDDLRAARQLYVELVVELAAFEERP